MTKHALLAALLLLACAPEPSRTQLSLALSAVPAQVQTIEVQVYDVEGARELVATASVAASITEIALGVPAERQLEFVVVAYTAERVPAAAGGGLLPAYVARVEQEIPLSEVQQSVQLSLRPAGLLYAELELSGALTESTLKASIRRIDGSEGEEIELMEEGVLLEAVTGVLREGYYELELSPEAGSLSLEGGTFYVGREVVNRARLTLTDAAPPVGALSLSLVDASGAPLETEPGLRLPASGALPVRVAVSAEGGASGELELELQRPSQAPLSIREDASLDYISEAVSIEGPGRLIVQASLSTTDAVLRGRLGVNLLPPGVDPGPPAELQLSLPWPEDRPYGSTLEAWLLDSAGYFAAPAGAAYSWQASSPWIYFVDGEAGQLSAASGYHPVEFQILQSSEPWAQSVIAVGSFTDTATVSFTLPSLF